MADSARIKPRHVRVYGLLIRFDPSDIGRHKIPIDFELPANLLNNFQVSIIDANCLSVAYKVELDWQSGLSIYFDTKWQFGF